MRKFLIIISLFFTSCISTLNNKQKLNKTNVHYIEIRKQSDTVSLRLTADQTTDFINEWNSSNLEGPYKFLPEYFLTIYFKGDSSLSYNTCNNLIKQKSDFAYSVGGKKYFRNIWFKLAGLPENYFEYYPIYFTNDKFSSEKNPLTSKQCNAIKQVFTFFNQKWIDIRGQIFYENKIDSELLWNYTTKANDTIWLSSHK